MYINPPIHQKVRLKSFKIPKKKNFSDIRCKNETSLKKTKQMHIRKEIITNL